ncbi:MAG: MazG nucleotide pyrophosphohydrolase domain-containing protein [bacterium]
MDEPVSGDVDETFNQLVELVEYLRSDEGCPWDRKQTMESMIECLQEESEEVVEAVRNDDMDNLEEELGDLILQGVFYAQMAAEKDLFTIDDVLARLNRKLIERHPHVFGEETAENPSEAIDQWNEVKQST